jgi:hypothetical protein
MTDTAVEFVNSVNLNECNEEISWNETKQKKTHENDARSSERRLMTMPRAQPIDLPALSKPERSCAAHRLAEARVLLGFPATCVSGRQRALFAMCVGRDLAWTTEASPFRSTTPTHQCAPPRHKIWFPKRCTKWNFGQA